MLKPIVDSIQKEFNYTQDQIQTLKEDLKNQRKDKQLAAIAAAVMHSTFYQSRVKSSTVTNPRWKSRMDR